MLVLVAVLAIVTRAADNSAKEHADIDFKGKVVVLVVDRSSALEKKVDTGYISDAVIQKIGDRYFISGAAYSWKDDTDKAPSRDWRRGSQVGVAWDSVKAFYLYSPKRMEEMIKKRTEDEKQ
jgi:thymidylate kinase